MGPFETGNCRLETTGNDPFELKVAALFVRTYSAPWAKQCNYIVQKESAVQSSCMVSAN